MFLCVPFAHNMEATVKKKVNANDLCMSSVQSHFSLESQGARPPHHPDHAANNSVAPSLKYPFSVSVLGMATTQPRTDQPRATWRASVTATKSVAEGTRFPSTNMLSTFRNPQRLRWTPTKPSAATPIRSTTVSSTSQETRAVL